MRVYLVDSPLCENSDFRPFLSGLFLEAVNLFTSPTSQQLQNFLGYLEIDSLDADNLSQLLLDLGLILAKVLLRLNGGDHVRCTVLVLGLEFIVILLQVSRCVEDVKLSLDHLLCLWRERAEFRVEHMAEVDKLLVDSRVFWVERKCLLQATKRK